MTLFDEKTPFSLNAFGIAERSEPSRGADESMKCPKQHRNAHQASPVLRSRRVKPMLAAEAEAAPINEAEAAEAEAAEAEARLLEDKEHR